MTLFRSLVSVLAFSLVASTCLHAASPGETRVAKWKDDKKAAFLVMFDDGWPSHHEVALPALVARQMVATFYICPAKGEFKAFQGKWETDFLPAGQVFANHTMTHKGVKSMEEAEYEIGDAAKYIRQVANMPEEKLVSFGRPGVAPGNWEITQEQLREVLKKHNMIERPDFKGHGAVYHWKTTEEMLALADKAIAEGGMEYLIIHGVQRVEGNLSYQDFWALNQEIFFGVLDGLKERRERGDLWVTDHISQHQYETEFATAKATTVFVKPAGIRLELKSEADPKQYDYPLTLVTAVPPSWKAAEVLSGGKVTKVEAKGGSIMFDAVPNSGFIDIREAK
jgi:peptidoglycan/xylan/chitin deacetylase (PgdA/CDA1 family)